MRDFFIRGFEVILGVFIVLLGIGVFFAGFVPFSDPQFSTGMSVLVMLLIWLGGGIYVLFLGGLMYLGLGIYQNTKRTAEAMERMAETPKP